MNLLITGHHLELTPAIRAYVEEKVDRILRHYEQVIEIEVILAIEEPAEKERRQRADINLRVKGDVLHAQSYAADIYAAIDTVIEKLDRQVAKLKGKVQAHQHVPVKHIQ